MFDACAAQRVIFPPPGVRALGLARLCALVFCAVVGFVIGAGCAAWIQRVDAPLTHGVVTAAGTYVLAQAVFVAIRLARGLDVQWFGVVFNLTVVTFAGVLGGFLGQRLRASGFVPGTKGRR